MIIRLKATPIAATALGLLFLPVREAKGEEALRVLVSNGMKAAIEELQPKLESAAGCHADAERSALRSECADQARHSAETRRYCLS